MLFFFNHFFPQFNSPKIQRDSKDTWDGAGPSHQTTSDTTKWMIPSSSTTTNSAVSKTLKTNESGKHQKN